MELFDTLDLYYQERSTLDLHMKEGYFQMSRARYNMGNKAVTSLQYNDKDMTALINVGLSKIAVGETESKESDDDSAIEDQFKYIPVKPANQDDEDNGSNSIKGTELRRRVTQKETESFDELSDKLNAVKLNEISSNKQQDPLTWFGVLVPQSLRQSQNSFKQAVESVCKVTTLQSKLLQLRKEYGVAMEKKRKLVTENVET